MTRWMRALGIAEDRRELRKLLHDCKTRKVGDQRRRNRSEKHQNFSEGVPAGQVRGKCRWRSQVSQCRACDSNRAVADGTYSPPVT